MNKFGRSEFSNNARKARTPIGAFAVLAVLIVAAAGLGLRVAAQGRGGGENPGELAYRTAMEDADQKIAAEVHAHSELMKNLEYLTTQIGPRLTGSPQMQAASQWTLKRFHDYGMDANLETTQVPHAWTRGMDTAEIISPIQRHIEIRSLGWSKATDGIVNGQVVVMESQSPEAIAAVKDKLKGAIVLIGRPSIVPLDGEAPDNAYDAVIPPQRGVPAARGGRGVLVAEAAAGTESSRRCRRSRRRSR